VLKNKRKKFRLNLEIPIFPLKEVFPLILSKSMDFDLFIPIDSKTTTGKFIVVDYSVKNLDSKARMIDADLFRINSGGNEFQPMQYADIMMILGDKNLFLEEVNPHMSREGQVVFEVPADLATYDLQISSGVGWSGGEYKTVKHK
jgi:hypothetical protein